MITFLILLVILIGLYLIIGLIFYLATKTKELPGYKNIWWAWGWRAIKCLWRQIKL